MTVEKAALAWQRQREILLAQLADQIEQRERLRLSGAAWTKNKLDAVDDQIDQLVIELSRLIHMGQPVL